MATGGSASGTAASATSSKPAIYTGAAGANALDFLRNNPQFTPYKTPEEVLLQFSIPHFVFLKEYQDPLAFPISITSNFLTSLITIGQSFDPDTRYFRCLSDVSISLRPPCNSQ